MKKRISARDKLLAELAAARDKGAEFICYAGQDAAVRIEKAMEVIGRMSEELADDAEKSVLHWHECDRDGRRVVRGPEINPGLTTHQSGVIVWSGSAEVFCGNWCDARGVPGLFEPSAAGKRGRQLAAVCIERQELDEDTLELAFEAAVARGDRSPSISEVFRVNGQATIITFDGWP